MDLRPQLRNAIKFVALPAEAESFVAMACGDKGPQAGERGFPTVVADVGRALCLQNIGLSVKTTLNVLGIEKGGDLGLARIDERDNVSRRRCCGSKSRLAVAPVHGNAALGKLA